HHASEQVPDLPPGQPLGDRRHREGEHPHDNQVDEREFEPTSGLPEETKRDPRVDEDRLEDSLVESRQNDGQHHGLRHSFSQMRRVRRAAGGNVTLYTRPPCRSNYYTASSLDLQPTIDAFGQLGNAASGLLPVEVRS